MIRTDKWPMHVDDEQKVLLTNTVKQYRLFCRALSIVILANWPKLANETAMMPAIERLVHPTKKNPHPKHLYFHKKFYKFPSYLRRAAINFAYGQVSSYMTRYGDWLDGNRRSKTDKPPVFNPSAGCFPALYEGQLYQFNQDYSLARLKLWDDKQWLWHDFRIKKTRQRHLRGVIKSPSLIIREKSCHLSVPVELKPLAIPAKNRVCAVDVGINTLATASVITPLGTVEARRFFHPAADIDRRNKRANLIRQKARKTAKLHKGFCKSLYRKARHISEQIAQITSRRLVEFARDNQADVIVLEDLKYWRPRGGRKRTEMRQRFHGWLHRRLATLIEQKFQEMGGKVVYVYPRGTSSWAYDGSGKLKRDPKQYELATFQQASSTIAT